MKKHIQLLALSLLMVVAAMYSSCKKEDAQPNTTTVERPTEGKYKKEITLKDDSGENWMKLEVSANSEEQLANFPVNWISLKVVRDLSTVLDKEPSTAEDAQQANNTPSEIPDFSKSIFLKMLEEHKSPGVLALGMTVKEPADGSGGIESREYSTRQTPWSVTANCGFGIYVTRAGNTTFSFDHGWKGNCGNQSWWNSFCSGGYWTSMHTSYFWGVRHSVWVYRNSYYSPLWYTIYWNIQWSGTPYPC